MIARKLVMSGLTVGVITGLGFLINSVWLIIVGITLGFAVIDAKSWYIPQGKKWAWECDDDLEDIQHESSRYHDGWIF